MNFLSAIEALLKLGLPALLLSWVIFHWMFAEGEIDRSLKHKALKSELKGKKKLFKNSGNRNARFVYKRWAWFGGGFYGLVAFWTFLVIESGELVSFVSAGNYLAGIDGTIIDLLISFLINQLTNSIRALLWFSYWPGPGDSILIWIAAGYLGYWAGIEMARRQMSVVDIFGRKSIESGKFPEVSKNEKK